MGLKKYIGDRAFYRMFLMIVIPMIIQNGITNFVNMLDNIMVGQLGTEPMSGVAISNQLIFVFNLCIFGAMAGPGIFCAQFRGSGNREGLKSAFRFKLLMAAAVGVLFTAGFALFKTELISLYLHRSDGAGDLAVTLSEGRRYLTVMLFGLIPFAFTNAFVSTLRETGETVLPMKAGVTAVLVNLCFNWLLIFGHMGFPQMGVRGAAVATVLSRYVELLIVVLWTHAHRREKIFPDGIFSPFRIPASLAGTIIRRGWPLMLNEFMFSMGLTMINQCYSVRGLSSIAAINISATLTNLFRIVMFAGGGAISIIVGNLLGAGKLEEARDTDRKLIATTLFASICVGAVLFALAPLFPHMYNTTDDVKALAAVFLRASAVMMPVHAITNGCYFTLRSGGKTFITFLFDSMFIWVFSLPVAFFTSRFTAMSIVVIYILVQSLDLIKAVGGLALLRSGMWVNNIVSERGSA